MSPQARDRAALIELLASPEVGTYLGGPRPRDELEREMPGAPERRPGLFIVDLDGAMIGQVILRRATGHRPSGSCREGRAWLPVPAAGVGIRVRRRGVRSGTRLARRRASRRAGGALYPDRQRPLDAPRGEAGVHRGRAVRSLRRRAVVRRRSPVTPSGQASSRRRSRERSQERVQASEVPRAMAAAMSIASSRGLAVDNAIVLQDSNKLTLRLLPCDALARVAPVAHQVAQFEIELAQRLARAGRPVAALEPRVEPRVYERDGFAVTLWTYYEPAAPHAVSPASYASALERLHAACARSMSLRRTSRTESSRLSSSWRATTAPRRSPTWTGTPRQHAAKPETGGRRPWRR